MNVDLSTGELDWFKSSHSGAEGGDCVEVAATPGTIHIRDSKNSTGATLTLPREVWTAFIDFTARH